MVRGSLSPWGLLNTSLLAQSGTFSERSSNSGLVPKSSIFEKTRNPENLYSVFNYNLIEIQLL